MSKDSIENKHLREAVERRLAKGETLSSVCRRLGYTRADTGRVDVTRLRRRLGMAPVTGGSRKGYAAKTRTIRYDIAVQICEAIGADPVDVGL